MNRFFAALIVVGLCAVNPVVAVAESAQLSARELRKAMRRPMSAQTTAKQKLAATCKHIQAPNFLIKADISHHVPRADARASGFTVIGSGRNCSPCPNGCDILYSNGERAGSVGYYGAWSRSHGGNGCSRYYGAAGGAPAHSASAIIATARRKGGKLYLSNRRGTCYEWSSSSRRVGNT